jgi:D-alanyl-D-alanine carboxypeptidase (penicillin-binding protein 5/6)
MKKFVRKHHRFVGVGGAIALVLTFAAVIAGQMQRPIPDAEITQVARQEAALPPASEIEWPESGQISVSVAGVGLLRESPNQQPQPIASLVKMMTAHVILKNHPLNPGEPGAEVVFQPHHVQNFQVRGANAESVVAVQAGGKMSERDLLRGLLLASGNNVADILAEWHAGSVEAFVAEMNAEAAALGMTDTVYADAAGLLATSRSTAHDQVVLANAAMANPTFASIVREAQAILPGAGIVYNTNSQLGQDGIVGIKTGWTEEAGACFVFASEQQVGGQRVTVIGATLGSVTLADAFARTRELIAASSQSMSFVTVATDGSTWATVDTPWGSSADAVLVGDANLLLLPGMKVTSNVELTTDDIEGGAEVGTATFRAGDQVVQLPLKASATISAPGLQWRLTRLR